MKIYKCKDNSNTLKIEHALLNHKSTQIVQLLQNVLPISRYEPLPD